MIETVRTPVSPTLLYRGRSGDPRLGELVLPLGETLDAAIPAGFRGEVVAIFGCPDDLGVRRNRGRSGARRGPEAIRRSLYKLTPPMDFDWEPRLRLVDAGDIVPAGDADSDIVETHRRAEALAAALAAKGWTVVLLGGGHDFAAPGFLGFLRGRTRPGRAPKAALLNVDPHLDMRPLEEGLPHSGTPFRQILDSGALPGTRQGTFGARPNRNSREAYRYAREKRSRIVTLESLGTRPAGPAPAFLAELRRLARGADAVGVTLDMDACRDTEGTSAAPVLGFSAAELCAFAAASGRERRVRYFELAEVAPELDAADRAGRIAAEILFAFLAARAGRR